VIVFRSSLSIVIALSIIVALTTGVCLGCPSLEQKGSGCCDHSNHCKMPKRTPGHQECAASVDFSKVEKPSASLLNFLIPDFAPATGISVALVAHIADGAPGRQADPYSPPDLCLLNSVLTI
jgi:hypothetical protein